MQDLSIQTHQEGHLLNLVVQEYQQEVVSIRMPTIFMTLLAMFGSGPWRAVGPAAGAVVAALSAMQVPIIQRVTASASIRTVVTMTGGSRAALYIK